MGVVAPVASGGAGGAAALLAFWLPSLVRPLPAPARRGLGLGLPVAAGALRQLAALPLHLALLLAGAFGGLAAASVAPPLLADALTACPDGHSAPTALAAAAIDVATRLAARPPPPAAAPPLQRWLALADAGAGLFALLHAGLAAGGNAALDCAATPAITGACTALQRAAAAAAASAALGDAQDTAPAARPSAAALLLSHPGVGLGLLRTLADALGTALRGGAAPSPAAAAAMLVMRQGADQPPAAAAAAGSPLAALLGPALREVSGAIFTSVADAGAAAELSTAALLPPGDGDAHERLRALAAHPLAGPAIFFGATASAGANGEGAAGADDVWRRSADTLIAFLAAMRAPPPSGLGATHSAGILFATDLARLAADGARPPALTAAVAVSLADIVSP